MTEQLELLEICLESMEREGLTVEECLARHGDAVRPLVPLLETAARYRAAPAVEPSRAFQAAARARMLNLIANTPTHSAPRGRTRPPMRAPFGVRPWYLLARVVAILAVMAALLMGSIELVAAAAPDSPLYPARLSLEEARVALALGDAERARLRMEMTERRAADLDWLVGRDSPAWLQVVAGLTENNLLEAVQASERAGEPSMAEAEVGLELTERQLRESLQRASASPDEQVVLRRTIAFMERERLELRERRGGWEPADGSTGPGSPSVGTGSQANPGSTPRPGLQPSPAAVGPATVPGGAGVGSDRAAPAGSPTPGSTPGSGYEGPTEGGTGAGAAAGGGAAGYASGNGTDAGSGPPETAAAGEPLHATATPGAEQPAEDPGGVLPTTTPPAGTGGGAGAPSGAGPSESPGQAGPSDGLGQAGPGGADEATPAGPAGRATVGPAETTSVPTTTPATQPSATPKSTPAQSPTATPEPAPTQMSTATPEPIAGQRGAPTSESAPTGGVGGGDSGGGDSSGSGGGGRR